jgi:hypothetical protein
MTYAEKQIERYHRRTARFLEILATNPPPMSLLAEEGALIIDALVAIAGPEALACYARNALKRSIELDGLCPWDHADDRSLHSLVEHGLCAECLTERNA